MRKNLARAGYLVLAAFILLAPSSRQVFGYSTGWVRAWIMYSGGGTGVLRGEFILSRDGQEIGRETPLQFFGLHTYPLGSHFNFAGRVLEEADLPRVAQARCTALEPDVKLSFTGFRATYQGWVAMDIQDICGGGR